MILLPIFMLRAQQVSLSVKVFLQGSYQGNAQMSAALNAGGYLPLSQPYHAGIWQHTGAEILSAIPAGMVDWVLVELRSQPDTVVARMAALLFSDGTVRDVNGNDTLRFSISPDHYYVAILHRTHLTAMTAGKLSFPVSGPVNFTDIAFAMYGTCLINMPGNVMGMIAGDINQDMTLKYSGSGNDRSLVLQRILDESGGLAIHNTASGYFLEDLRMDGTLKYSGADNDPALIIQNLVNLNSSTAINATFTGSVPHAVFATATCGDSLTDLRDGKRYPTVQIGTQCWMASNLNIGVMVNSLDTGGSHSDVSNNSIIEKYCFNNDASYCDQYGGLYDWDEMMNYDLTPGIQGICPEGWHVPTAAELCTLASYLDSTFNCNSYGWRGTNAGGKLKNTGFLNWNSPNTGATNESGFSGLGAGGRSYFGSFNNILSSGYFWSSTEYDSLYSIYIRLTNQQARVYYHYYQKTFGFSVRCLRDH